MSRRKRRPEPPPREMKRSGVFACPKCSASVVFLPVRGPAMPVVLVDAAATLTTDPTVLLYTLDGRRVPPSTDEVAGHRPHKITCRKAEP